MPMLQLFLLECLFAVCDYFTHDECKEFSVSDCKKCASYSPHIKKVLYSVFHGTY